MNALQLNTPSIISKRRLEVLTDTSVISKLDKNETKILAASTKTQIKALDEEQIKGLSIQVLKDICVIVGCNISSLQQSSKSITKLFIDNYTDWTFSEIITAFEMLAAGQLDTYLVNKNDKNHYQQLSAMYVSTILTAYQKMRREVFKKIEEIRPTPFLLTQNSAEIRKYIDKAKALVLNTYNYFKENNRLPEELTSIDKEIIYSKLNELSLSEDIKVSEKDKQAAFTSMLSGHAKSRNKVKSVNNNLVRFYFSARAKAISKAFNNILINKIDLESKLNSC